MIIRLIWRKTEKVGISPSWTEGTWKTLKPDCLWRMIREFSQFTQTWESRYWAYIKQILTFKSNQNAKKAGFNFSEYSE